MSMRGNEVDFGRNIRRIRKQRGLTQVALGDLASLSQSYISMIEANQRPNVSALNLKRIADALGVTREELLKEK